MPDSTPPVNPVEILQTFIQAAVFDRDEEAVKKLVTKASIEQGKFNPPPDAHEMTITLGEPAQEGEEWVVPMSIVNPKDDSQPPMNMPMTLTLEEGQWKIDMIRTMERLFGGGGLDAVVDGMVDALKGVGEAMADGLQQAFEGMGEAMNGAMSGTVDDENFNRLPDEASPSMREIFDIYHAQVLPDQLSLMREALGGELNVHIDWNTLQGDTEVAKKIPQKVLHPLRSAICLSCSDDKLRDGLRENLRDVLITHIDYPEGKSLRFEGNRLHITTNLNDVGPGIGYHKSDEIMAALRDALDLDKGPAVEHLMTQVIPQLREQILEHLSLELDIDIDLASFMDAYDTDTALRHLQKIESDLFRNLIYHLSEADKKVPLADRLTRLRLEHVASPQFRVLLASGTTLVYRLCFTEEGGCYYGNEMDEYLPGVVATLPDHSDPAAQDLSSEPAFSDQAPTAFGIISDYRDQRFAELCARTQEAFGRQLDIEVDWASIGDDVYAADQLRVWGLNRVVGAARLAARDEQARQDMIDTFSSLKLICVPTIEQKQIAIDGGDITLHLCLTEGERGCFYETDIAAKIVQSLGSEFKPIIADLRNKAQYWEDQLSSEQYQAPATFYIDFAGFTSSPEDQHNRFALSLLAEHGINALYYAITKLLGNNPNFAQQFRKRVRRLLINHTATPAGKRVGHLDDAIVLELFLHEGYKGYLTIDDLVKRLPGIVAEMIDLPDEPLDEATNEIGATESEQAELNQLERLEDEMEDEESDDSDDDDQDETESDSSEADLAFGQMRTEIMNMLPGFSQQFAAFLGKPIPVTIDWESLQGDAMAMNHLLNACLAPIIGGLMTLGQDAGYREDVIKFVDTIELRRAASLDEQAMSLNAGVLSMSVFLTDAGVQPMQPDEATAIFRGMIDYVRALPDEPKKTPPPKARPKPAAKKTAKKAAPKKTESKAKAKPAPKSSAKPKKPDKGKGKGKK